MADTKKDRSKIEIELNERKLDLECKKLDIELKNGEYILSSSEREDIKAKSQSSQARVYNFVDKVSSTTVKTCVNTLEEWARRNTEPVTIVFNSPGGEVFPGLALFDAILALREKGIDITTVCRGWAASMGGVLFQAGKERVIGQNSYMLIHEVSDIAVGTTADLEDELEFTKRVQKRLVNILAERSTLSAKQIEAKWKKTDWWVDADECIKYGFADRIG
jgi:ATP-dependent Clp endopeptidase proteolytic subunit ClpP